MYWFHSTVTRKGLEDLEVQMEKILAPRQLLDLTRLLTWTIVHIHPVDISNTSILS